MDTVTVCAVLMCFLACGHCLFEPHGGATMAELAMQIANLTAEVNHLKAQESETVMFTAHMKHDPFSISTNGLPLVFDNAIANYGGGYDPATGVFQAPVSGNYLFILQIMAPTGTDMVVRIQHQAQSQVVLYVNEDDHSDMSIVTSLLHVNRGEKVKVVRNYGVGKTDLRGGLWSQFSGTLLQAD